MRFLSTLPKSQEVEQQWRQYLHHGTWLFETVWSAVAHFWIWCIIFCFCILREVGFSRTLPKSQQEEPQCKENLYHCICFFKTVLFVVADFWICCIVFSFLHFTRKSIWRTLPKYQQIEQQCEQYLITVRSTNAESWICDIVFSFSYFLRNLIFALLPKS